MARIPFRAARAALFSLVLVALLRAEPAIAGPDEDVQALRKTVEGLKTDMQQMKEHYEKKISDLEKTIAERGASGPTQSDLEAEIDDLLDRVDSTSDQIQLLKSSGGGKAAYIDISWNSLTAAGTSTAPEELIPELEGGHHDPHKRGFTVQNEELYLQGAVDPYFYGAANIVWTIDEGGETIVELEEAYAQTTSLPYGLQVKAGQYFTEIGRINPQHPHQWDFVDQQLVSSRMFGEDGLRGPGARISWLTPVSFPLEVQVGMQNANGETTFPFLSEEEAPIGALRERGVRTFEDLLTVARITASTDVTDELPLQFGTSAAWGPSGATSSRTTRILGVDFVAKWHPLATDLGFPFVTFQSEWMWRHYPYDPFEDPDSGAVLPGGSLDDSGGYAQAVWGFQRDWTVGARYDHVSGRFDDVFGLDDHDRYSAAVTYYTSHFAKIRFQVNHDRAAGLDKDYTSFWLQLEINFGAHGAHNF